MYSRIRVKMCGFTRAEDVQHAVLLGVDALGFIFYEHSPRHVSIEQAKPLIQGLPAFVNAIAVFVNPTASLVLQVIDALAIQYLQFHGDETAAFCDQFGKPYIKTIRATTTEAITEGVLQYPHAASILLETPSATSYGGTGIAFDWHRVPAKLAKPVILAGGLDASNVKAAIMQCSPYAVDVCSKIEISPGIKDHQKMSQFISAIGGCR